MSATLATVERFNGVPSLVYRLHPGQTDAWDARERYVAIIAGSGGGKTSFGALWMAREAERSPGAELIALAPTNDMRDRVLVPRLLEALGTLGAEYQAARSRILLAGGGVVHLVSAEKPERAEGIHAHAVWMDEAGQMAALMWEVVRRRVGAKRGRVLITTTPYNLGWLKSEVHDRALAGEPEYRVIRFPSTQNPAYPREEFERARRELPPDRFAMFYLGEFRRASGLVYPDFSPDSMLVDPFPIPDGWRQLGGLDFGWNAPTAALWLAESPDGTLYATAEHYRSTATIDDHAAALAARGPVPWHADPSGAQLIAELKKRSLDVRDANNDVRAGIDAVTRLIRGDHFRVFRGRCPNLLREFESYAWEQRDDQSTDKPRKQDDHLMDALRYAAAALLLGAPEWRTY